MRKKIIILILFLIIPFLAFAQEKTKYPSCDFDKSYPVSFTSISSKDTLKISIKESPCYEAFLNIQIISEKGDIVYSYKEKFIPHVVTDWDYPHLDRDAEALIESLVDSCCKETTKNLPPYLPKDEYYEEYYNVIKISKSEYNSLRKQNYPIFTHLTGYETWRSIIFDKKTGKSKIIFAGGL